MSSTLTCTVAQTPALHLLGQLVAIMEKYEDREDDLSKQLIHWGTRTVVLITSEKGEDLRDQVIQSLDTLAQEILVDSLTQQPLQTPLLEGDWVWEKTVLDDFRTLSNRSPLTAKPIQTRVHEFAQEMVEWLRAANQLVPRVPLSTTQEDSTAHLFHETVSKQHKLANYAILAKKAHALKRDRAVRIACESAMVGYHRGSETISSQFQERIEELEKRVQESEQSQKHRIESLREQDKQHIEILNTRVDHLEEAKEATQSRLEHAEESIVSLKERNQQLIDEQKRDKQTIRNLQDEVDSMCVLQ